MNCKRCHGKGQVDYVFEFHMSGIFVNGDEFSCQCPRCDGTGVHKTAIEYVKGILATIKN